MLAKGKAQIEMDASNKAVPMPRVLSLAKSRSPERWSLVFVLGRGSFWRF